MDEGALPHMVNEIQKNKTIKNCREKKSHILKIEVRSFMVFENQSLIYLKNVQLT